jgi:glucose/arabinose dehydrogenase
VYASYTDLQGDSILERRHVDGSAPPEVVLKVAQPYANHNGGHVLFGPDGMLWYGLGDGGSAGDPHGNGQNPHSLLASMLRLDASPATGYAIPKDNPYADGAAGRPEVWAKGLRNPWRFSFDRATGDLWIGDVGQNAWEEIDRVAAPLHGGLNFGWNAFEGNHAYARGTTPFSPVTPPVAEYGHDEGCAVTGGFAYRGGAVPALQGTYLFSDACSGHLWGLRPEGTTWNLTRLMETGASVVSFGEDDAGEVYLVDHGGRILEIAPAG